MAPGRFGLVTDTCKGRVHHRNPLNTRALGVKMRLVSPVETGLPASVNRYLLPHERSVITVRMHPATLTGHLVMAGAGLLAAMKLTSRSARREIAWGGYLLFPLYFLYQGAAWPATYLVVTNERMMLVRGMLTRTAAAMPLEKVTGL